ncbi:branched-chain amino acid ABC transporter permease [Mesorhizobium australicum]|uniref:Amino acid/amide ABC transporter membrane protein 1, HAAT family n=1 Tax=Mesorhizobium australicum TaxID=536018 RepID=A0A1X7N092_9HYPH|nr:branched-chain amino acid ABC transporter permease [Mesorhizobium australicum]SMH30633.1 amino acid/amide ABC transporter membrane protein 1, HAAT family [Mesorhizobium australicum]
MTELLNILAVGLLLGGIYALVAVGLNLIFGVIRVVNFAQGEFVMLGMYGAYAAQLAAGLDPYIAPIVVVPLLFLLGCLIYGVILRPLQGEPMMQVFATFGLLMVLENTILAVTRGITYSVDSVVTGIAVEIGPVFVGLPRLLVLAAATIVTFALGWYLRSALNGKAIRAVAQDRTAARLMGINVERIYVLTFGIGTALAGLAGCLLSPLYTMSPQIGMNFIMPAFAVVVLGGLGSVAGAFVGGFIVGLTEAFAGYYIDPALKHAVLFFVFITVLVVRPSGLFGVAGAEEVGLREQH